VPDCPRRIFAERFDGVLARCAPRTDDATELLTAFALPGRRRRFTFGKRTATGMRKDCSSNTLAAWQLISVAFLIRRPDCSR
jgi:hypothetical protein